MNTEKSPFPPTSLTLEDLFDDGRYASYIIGELAGPDTYLYLVATDEFDSRSPVVVEIHPHTHVVFFSRTQIDDIAQYLAIALQGSPIESEAGMRIVGVLSQLAFRAYFSYSLLRS